MRVFRGILIYYVVVVVMFWPVTTVYVCIFECIMDCVQVQSLSTIL